MPTEKKCDSLLATDAKSLRALCALCGILFKRRMKREITLRISETSCPTERAKVHNEIIETFLCGLGGLGGIYARCGRLLNDKSRKEFIASHGARKGHKEIIETFLSGLVDFVGSKLVVVGFERQIPQSTHCLPQSAQRPTKKSLKPSFVGSEGFVGSILVVVGFERQIPRSATDITKAIQKMTPCVCTVCASLILNSLRALRGLCGTLLRPLRAAPVPPLLT